ncbi:uncharacterized protein TNCT_584481 [Trichonephila clavata]|uniref:Uncharacterized protein n=1 Tax=Trichonephila clavata TaxID=2740835 RepID=A0A8X6H844_TRICU|nr:uncharacterized protein TNCT_584481 [Trichonephila clavata]
MCLLLNSMSHVVRASEHDVHPVQLHHTGHVPTVCRRGVHLESVSPARDVRRLHFRLLRHRDDDQDHRHGHHGEGLLHERLLEQTRLLYSFCWVSFHYLSYFAA